MLLPLSPRRVVGPAAPISWGKGIGVDHAVRIPGRHDQEPLHDIAKLAHITGPIVTPERRHDIVADNPSRQSPKNWPRVP